MSRVIRRQEENGVLLSTPPKRKRRRGSLLPRLSRGEVAILSLFSLLAAYGGPFGTFDFSFGRRLLYWSLVVVSSALMAAFFARWARQRNWVRKPLVADLMVVGLMTLCFTPILLGLTGYLLPRQVSRPDSYIYFAQLVAVITLGVTLSRRVIPHLVLGSDRHLPFAENDDLDLPEGTGEALGDEDVPDEPDPAMEEPEGPPRPRLYRRLPEGTDGEILRLTSEDHFVDVVTTDGTHRLRMRLADAIAELDTVEGLSTHRSHWVAREAIAGAEREGGRQFLVLVNGDRVPVSRTYKPVLEEAGLL